MVLYDQLFIYCHVNEGQSNLKLSYIIIIMEGVWPTIHGNNYLFV